MSGRLRDGRLVTGTCKSLGRWPLFWDMFDYCHGTVDRRRDWLGHRSGWVIVIYYRYPLVCHYFFDSPDHHCHRPAYLFNSKATSLLPTPKNSTIGARSTALPLCLLLGALRTFDHLDSTLLKHHAHSAAVPRPPFPNPRPKASHQLQASDNPATQTPSAPTPYHYSFATHA